MPQTHSTATIAQALSGIDFPARKSDLVEYAKRNNAGNEVIDALKEMPDDQYTSMVDVFKCVDVTR